MPYKYNHSRYCVLLHVVLLNVAGCGVKCGSLKDNNKREEFMEEISEEYEEIREEHYDSLKVKALFETRRYARSIVIRQICDGAVREH